MPNSPEFAVAYYGVLRAGATVTTLNTLVQTIPWMFFAGFAKVSTREFYKAPEGQQAPPTVSF